MASPDGRRPCVPSPNITRPVERLTTKTFASDAAPLRLRVSVHSSSSTRTVNRRAEWLSGIGESSSGETKHQWDHPSIGRVAKATHLDYCALQVARRTERATWSRGGFRQRRAPMSIAARPDSTAGLPPRPPPRLSAYPDFAGASDVSHRVAKAF